MNLKLIYEKIGQDQGIAGEEVKKQIQKAIDASFALREENQSEFWSKVSKDGKSPNADDVIFYIVNEMMKKNK